MARNISALCGIESWRSHDPLDGYLRDNLGINEEDALRAFTGSRTSTPLQITDEMSGTASLVDYGGFLRVMRDFAAAKSGQEAHRDVFVTHNLPSPNLLTFLYGALDVSKRHQRHMRETRGQTVMSIVTNLNAGPARLVELNYIRPGRDQTRPDARIALYPGKKDVVNLQAYGPLWGEGNIAKVPGVHDVLKSDVQCVALRVLAHYGIEQSSIE